MQVGAKMTPRAELTYFTKNGNYDRKIKCHWIYREDCNFSLRKRTIKNVKHFKKF